MLQNLEHAFAQINEYASIIVCAMMLISAGIFVLLLMFDKRQYDHDQKTICDLSMLVIERDKQIKMLEKELKHVKAERFAARADCERECKKRDKAIAKLEYKLDQLLKWNDK